MGSILDGQPVNASVTNNAKVDKQTDDTIYGDITLADPAYNSITSLQNTLNIILQGIGGTQSIPATGYSPVPTDTILATQTHEQALRALATKFYGAASAGGHSHTGADGDGALIQQTSINGQSGGLVFAASGGQQIIQSGSTFTFYAPTGGTGGGGIGYQEPLSGVINGTNAIFSLTQYPSSSGSVAIFNDGMIIPQITGFAASGQQITFQTGWIPQPGQDLYAFYLINGSGTGPISTGNQVVEYRTISSGEASAKFLTLAQLPAVGTKTMVDVIGGVAQAYGLDFTVTGNVLDWNGLGLDSIPTISGDVFRIVYFT
jgi:hypothetical protein